MKTEFDNLRLNDDHQYSTNDNGGKLIVYIYKDDNLIAKKITHKKRKKIQYFGVKNYKDFII